MNEQYDNRGKVSLWKGHAESERAPVLKGTVYAHRDIREGEILDIALWKNETENPKAPVLRGKISDKFKPEEQQGFRDTENPAPQGQKDDDLPDW